MEVFVESIDEIKLGRKIGGGSCSEIFEMKPGVYFKKFCDDYTDLSDPINWEFFETIKNISGIDLLPFIVRAKDIYRTDGELFGYSMDRIDALTLEKVSDDVLVSDVMNGFELLKPSVRKLSDNYVKTEDIGGDNILFNGNMYLLDLDLSLIDKRYIPDELYEATRKSIFKSLYNRITGDFFTGIVNDDDYSFYMSNLIDRCSDGVGTTVKSLGEVRKAYQKIYKKTTIN